MRKHFLILMLLTLLPLAGWATDYTVKIQIGSDAAAASLTKTYTGSAFTIAAIMADETDITSNAEYTKTWYKGDVEYTGTFTDAGTYTLKVTKAGDTFTDATLTISPIDISTGWVVDATDNGITYDAKNQTIATIAGIKTGTSATVNVSSATDWATTWTFNGAAYNPAADVTKAGTYTVTIAPTVANVNYEGSVTKNFTVAKAQLDITAKNVTITYGDALPSISAFYEAAGWQTNSSSVDDNEQSEGVVPVTLQTAVSNSSVQTTSYTLLANELPNYYINFVRATATYAVSAKAVTVTPNWEAGTYAYGDELPAITANFTPLAFDDQPSVLGIPTAVFYKYATTAATELPANAEKLTEMSDAGKYQVTFEGLNNNANYNVTIDTRDFIIGQKELAASMITLKSGEAAFSATYDKTQHIPTVVVKNGETTLVEKIGEADGQYTVKYYKGSSEISPATATAFVAAGEDYKVVISAVAGGNYKDAATPASKPFTIARKPVSLRTVGRDAQPYSGEVYSTTVATGKYYLTNTANLYWDGIVNGDLNATTNLLNEMGGAAIALDLYDGATKLTGGETLQAKNYTVTATITGVTADAQGVYPIGNYAVTLGNIGKVKITKKEITITAKNQSVDFGTNNQFKVATAIGPDAEVSPTASPYNTIANYLWIGTLNTDGDAIVDGTGFVGTDDYSSVFGYAENRVKLQREEGNNADDYDLNVIIPVSELGNYKFIAGAAATYTINPIGGVQVWANTAHSAYKATPATLSAEIVGIATADMSEDLQDAVDASLYVDVDGDDQDDDDVTTANAGVYTIKFDQTKLAAAFANMPNYNVESIAQFTANYTVDRAALTVMPKAQVRMVGEGVVAEGSSETVDYKLADGQAQPTAADLTAIYSALHVAFNVTTGVLTQGAGETFDINETTGKLQAKVLTHGTAASGTPVNGEYYNGLKIVDADVAAYNSNTTAGYNYTLTAELGQLTATTNVVLELDAAEATNTELLNANVGKKLNVTIKNKNMNANKWYTISLPFAITPFEFCEAIGGYAIFDRLQKTGDKLSFKISLDAIPAYTPFLVKVDSRVELGTVVFEKVTVETPVIVETEKNDTWIVNNTIDAGDVDGLVYWLASNRGDGLKLDLNETKGTFNGFDAYFTTVDGQKHADARIFIEEPDGTTTAISNIAADGEMIPAEGWYTVNGIRLQSAPTEKGIYINNGKKIVVK